MDYSVVAAIDESTNELVVAVIDYLRQYTWDKKMESWVKKTGLLGGGAFLHTLESFFFGFACLNLQILPNFVFAANRGRRGPDGDLS